MKYYIMFGPPGAGKGTHAVAIREKYNLCHISTGELLRAEIAAGTELGLQAKTLIDNGNLVPDEVVERMIAAKFDSVKNVDGFLLDGFPRTVEQAEILNDLLAKNNQSLDGVLNFQVSDDVVVERMLARGRADDNEETIRTRMSVYRDETMPLIDHYGDQIIDIKAEGTVDEINDAAMKAIGK